MENIRFSFPPSANWFCYNCIDISCKGVVAYAALKDVVTQSNESKEDFTHLLTLSSNFSTTFQMTPSQMTRMDKNKLKDQNLYCSSVRLEKRLKLQL